MKCQDCCEQLVALHYDELEPTHAQELRRHLEDCIACQREYANLVEVTRILDTASSPEVAVDVQTIYDTALSQQQRSLRRWKRTAIALAATAACLLVAIFFRFEVHWQQRQFIVAWGSTPREPSRPTAKPLPPVTAAPQPSPEVSPEEFEVVRELVHALVADVESRDEDQRKAITRLQMHLRFLQENVRTTQQDVRALYAVRFGSQEGE